ncbi:hypothetical protein [Streptomyces sp. NPDC086182]|jgi:hypothetical protein
MTAEARNASSSAMLWLIRFALPSAWMQTCGVTWSGRLVTL